MNAADRWSSMPPTASPCSGLWTSACWTMRSGRRLLPGESPITLPLCAVAPRPKGWKPPLTGGVDQIERWMRHHAIGPCHHDGVDVHVQVAPSYLTGPDTWRERDDVMVAGFEDGAVPDNSAAEPRFRSDRLTGADQRVLGLEAVVLAVGEGPLRVLVLPELSLPPALRDELLDRLLEAGAPLLTVPGSYHCNDGERVHNMAMLVDLRGVTLLVQRKIQPLLVERVQEEIVPGTAIELLVGPWGTLVVAICRDFCELHQGAWEALAPDVVLVPSMGNPATMRAHERRASDLHRAAASLVCVANQPTTDWGEAARVHGAIFQAGRTWKTDPQATAAVRILRVAAAGGRLQQD